MRKQTLCFKVLLPLNLLLLSVVTACSRPAPESITDSAENTQTTVETPDDSAIAREPATDSDVSASTEGVAEMTLALSGEGVLMINNQTGNTQAIPFEMDVVTSQAIVSAVLGDPMDITQNNECGAGPMSFITWDNGFTMNVMQDQFVGWSVHDNTESANLTTVEGVGVGKTRADLDANYSVEVFESSLGTEFSAADQLFGLLSTNEPDGTITHLWAGVACNFR